MKKTFDAIVFGSATIDVFLTSGEFGNGKSRESKFRNKKPKNKSDHSVLQLPHDAKIEVERATVCSGGGGTNVAVGLARLGLKTAVAARLGQDQFAPVIVDELRREGVWTKMLAVEPGEETDYSTILVVPKKGKVILVSRGKTRLNEQNISWDKLSTAWFHLASLEGNLRLVQKIFTFARREGIKISWNPGSRELQQREKLFSLMDGVDVFILNQQETETLLEKKMTNKDFWSTVFDLPVRIIAITQGKRGAWLVFPHQKKKTHLEALSSKIVETTGAGDAFCSGLIAGLFYQKRPREAVYWGLSNGASVVGQFGAKTGLLTKRGANQWLRKK